MGKGLPFYVSLLLASALFCGVFVAKAGDEDVREDAPKQERKIEEPAEQLPPLEAIEPSPDPAIDAPELSAEEAVAEVEAPLAAKKKKSKIHKKPTEPDDNIDYRGILSSIEPESLPQMIRPEALGTRAYRPHMIAIGIGDRTPGYGIMLEYSWNRLGVGASYSYRLLKPEDASAISQSFGNLFVNYHWLPFWMTPYFLLGVEVASQTTDSFGAIAGIGVETQIHNGWTILFGYTYHTTLRDGFLGGSLGWAF